MRKSVPAAELEDFQSYYKEFFPHVAPSAMQGLYAKFEASSIQMLANPSASLDNITTYVQEHMGGAPFGAMHKLYSQFPVYHKAVESASAIPQVSRQSEFEVLPSVGTWLSPHRARAWQPFVLADTVEPVPMHGASFRSLPSVATWLSPPRPKAFSSSYPPCSAPRHKLEQPVGGQTNNQAFAMRPSVATWLATKLPKIAIFPESDAFEGSNYVASVDNFKSYYSQNFVPGPMPSLTFSKFERAAGPSKAATRSHASDISATFRHKPSVGSWLAAKPFIAEPDGIWSLKPSVGTWLSARPPQTEEGKNEERGAMRPRVGSVADRRDSEIERMSKEEMLTVVRDELASKDQEIEELKARLARLSAMRR